MWHSGIGKQKTEMMKNGDHSAGICFGRGIVKDAMPFMHSYLSCKMFRNYAVEPEHSGSFWGVIVDLSFFS